MQEQSTYPYDWLRTISPSLLEREEVPPWGGMASFPWQQLAESLNGLFGFEKFALRPKPWEWRQREQFLEGLSNDPYRFYVGLSGYKGYGLFLVDKLPLHRLIETLLQPYAEESPIQLAQESYFDDFFRFFTIELLHQVASCGWHDGLDPYLLPDQPSDSFEEPEAFALDIHFERPGEQFVTRLLVNDQLRQELLHEARQQASPSLNEKLAQKLELSIGMQVGSFKMSERQLADLALGDFIPLEQCTLEPSLEQGQVTLVAYELPIYMAQLQGGKLILQGPPKQHEQSTID